MEFTAGKDIKAQGNVISNCGGHILSAKKNFDIPHPTKEGWRLRHTCPEGPSNDVYYRGRVINKTYIELPLYWEKLVDPTTITVNLTPIGAHQHVIVKRVEPTLIHLQSNGGIPINCFFHVYGTIFTQNVPLETLLTVSDTPFNATEHFLVINFLVSFVIANLT